MRRNHTVVVTIDGTADFREWLLDQLEHAGRNATPADATLRIVAGPGLAVHVSGYSTCEEDDRDHDYAERVRDAVDAIADDYPGGNGLDRWGAPLDPPESP